VLPLEPAAEVAPPPPAAAAAAAAAVSVAAAAPAVDLVVELAEEVAAKAAEAAAAAAEKGSRGLLERQASLLCGLLRLISPELEIGSRDCGGGGGRATVEPRRSLGELCGAMLWKGAYRHTGTGVGKVFCICVVGIYICIL